MIQHDQPPTFAISLLLPLALLLTGCHTYTQAPGAVGRVVDAETGAPVRGAYITRPFIARGSEGRIGIPAEGLPATTVSSDASGRFNLAPATHTQIAFMHLSNPETVSSSFEISATGYTTNVLHGVATSRGLWRADLGKVLLRKP
jgi:hypothetical protein